MDSNNGARNFARYLVAFARSHDPEEVVDEIKTVIAGKHPELTGARYYDIVEVSSSRPFKRVCGHILYISHINEGVSIELDTYHTQTTICDGRGMKKDTFSNIIPSAVWDAIEDFCAEYSEDDVSGEGFDPEDYEGAINLTMWSKEVYYACECRGCGREYSNTMMIEGNESEHRLNAMAGQDLRNDGWVRHDDRFWCPKCASEGFDMMEAE